MDSWIGHHQHLDVKLKHFFVANMLRHWDETIAIIQKEPSGQFDGELYHRHPFVSKMHNALMLCNISKETFKGWVKVVKHGFINRNIISMSKQDCEEVGYENIQIDGRSFFDMTANNAKQ